MKKQTIIFIVSFAILFIITFISFKNFYPYPISGYSIIPEALFHSLLISFTIIASINKKIVKALFTSLGIAVLGEIIWYAATANSLYAGSGGFQMFAYIPLGVLIGFIVPLIINPLLRKFYLKET